MATIQGVNVPFAVVNVITTIGLPVVGISVRVPDHMYSIKFKLGWFRGTRDVIVAV